MSVCLSLSQKTRQLHLFWSLAYLHLKERTKDHYIWILDPSTHPLSTSCDALPCAAVAPNSTAWRQKRRLSRSTARMPTYTQLPNQRQELAESWAEAVKCSKVCVKIPQELLLLQQTIAFSKSLLDKMFYVEKGLSRHWNRCHNCNAMLCLCTKHKLWSTSERAMQLHGLDFMSYLIKSPISSCL